MVLAAVSAFVGGMAQAGANWESLTVIKAAAVSAGAAVFIAVQGALAALTSPKSSDTASLPRALVQRARSGSPSAPTAFSAADLAALDRLADAIKQIPPPPAPPGPVV